MCEDRPTDMIAVTVDHYSQLVGVAPSLRWQPSHFRMFGWLWAGIREIGHTESERNISLPQLLILH